MLVERCQECIGTYEIWNYNRTKKIIKFGTKYVYFVWLIFIFTVLYSVEEDRMEYDQMKESLQDMVAKYQSLEKNYKNNLQQLSSIRAERDILLQELATYQKEVKRLRIEQETTQMYMDQAKTKNKKCIVM